MEFSSTSLIGWLLAFIATGGALGWSKYLLEKRVAVLTMGLSAAQIEREQAITEKTKIEASHTVIEGLSLGFITLKEDAARIRLDRDELRIDRDQWKAEALAAKAELDQLKDIMLEIKKIEEGRQKMLLLPPDKEV